MTRDAARKHTQDAFADELCGILLRGYADVFPQLASKPNDQLGKSMLNQMRAAREVIGKVFDRLVPAEAEPTPTHNGTAVTPRK